MSSSESESQHTFSSECSDYECEVDIEEEIERHDQRVQVTGDNSEDENAYQDEPLADEEWIENYNERLSRTEELETELQKRLNGTTATSEWCKCGNCNVDNLQNISECYCCTELDGCVEALASDIVTQDLLPGVTLSCITEHPGFNPVCLQKWSLRLAADSFKTKDRKRYKQTESEERFLRSVAYREFTRLVYGWLGSSRVPLPACAYVAIRQAFPVTDQESFTGFDLDEDE